MTQTGFLCGLRVPASRADFGPIRQGVEAFVKDACPDTPHPAAAQSILAAYDPEQQRMVSAMLRDYPSLAAQADGLLRDAYPHAITAALMETGLDRGVVPADAPSVQALLQFEVA